MKLILDQETNQLYIQLSENPSVESEEIYPGIVADFDENNKIIVDENMSTNIPGLYAAGDCTGGLLQISKAVYEGAKAGTEIIKYLRNNSKKISA